MCSDPKIDLSCLFRYDGILEHLQLVVVVLAYFSRSFVSSYHGLTRFEWVPFADFDYESEL